MRLPRQLQSALTPLSLKDFRLFFLGRAISLLGSAFAPIAAAFALISIGGHTTDLALLIAGQVIAQVTFMLIGGVWSDRLPRNLIMASSHLFSFAIQALIAILLLTGHCRVWELIMLATVRGCASAFFSPAAGGIIPLLVPNEKIQEANSLIQLTSNGTEVLGAALAGIVISLSSPGWAYAIDASSFLIAAVFLFQIKLPPMSNNPRGKFLAELHVGWKEFISRSWIWIGVAQFAVINSLGTACFAVLGPFIAASKLGGPWAWGIVLACQAAGMAGGSLLGFGVKSEHPLRIAFPAAALTCLPILFLGLGAPLILIASSAVIAGAGLQLFSILWETGMQKSVPIDKLSRIASYDAVGSFAFMPLAIILIAPLSQSIGLTKTLVISAIIIAFAALISLPTRPIWNFRPQPEEDNLPSSESL